ncbi:bifunctional aspartate kinase/homoserine dehydrogenase II [Leclercia sp.]|uniref:bifunctional aspartate kinase/homoserine dehydrogenase II n=1 Tax=Leclercia sp. TaxID=1898428 RepID=UPI0028BE84FA|nr:bifunctional aspartate kinase/homoserine dehydrogenase II [Leclercia sp.]
MSVIAQAGAKGRQLHKFGGSSLADVKCYLRVAGIMSEYSMPGDMMVVSAAGSTTNQLISWLKLSQTDRLSAHQVQQALRRYQSELIAGLLPADVADGLISTFIQDLERLAGLLDSGVTDAVYAEVVGHGEVWSARLMAAVLQQQGLDAAWLDARDFLRAERGAQPQVDEGLSYPLLQQLLVQHPNKRIVVTGFISRSNAGETVLLGRNGSDYSATQIGALAGVSRVTIWSDVAGVYSADPRKVKDACLLPLLRLDEASELARLAAPVLHARTLQPVSGSDIDLQLRCSYTPDQGSTRIERVLASGTGARIVTSHDDICLIEFLVPAGHDFKQTHKEIDLILKRAQVRPLAVGVHTDRHLLQFCYTAEVADSALKILDEAGLPGELRLRQGLALIAMVGAGVTRNPLHCHRFWQQLKGQPVEFTWQSEEGISLVAVMRTGPTESLIQGLHQSLFRAEKRIGLVLFGKGNIGSRWLELFAREQTTLSARTGFEFVLAGVVDSRRSLLSYEGLDASRALAFFNDEAIEQDEESLFLWMRAHPYDDLVVLDVTASEQLANQYLDFASHGFHVISANKLAGASNTRNYRQIHDAFEKTGRHWLYNATVGAGLPVNHTVRDLIESGDSILAISGIFSGTLSWLFLQFDGTVPFTELVTDLVDQAWQQGLTEPDPRVDLSGKDVMRKLVIVAREAGYDIEPGQVRVESLVPTDCEEGSVDHFFENGDALNEQMLQRLEAAREMGLVLRYVARFDANGKARVGVEAVRPEHPLAALLPCDNVFAIESRWYRDNPLVIRGPGAGRDVTAGAIQSDINRLAQLL